MACNNLFVIVILGVAPLTGVSNKGSGELGYAGGKSKTKRNKEMKSWPSTVKYDEHSRDFK